MYITQDMLNTHGYSEGCKKCRLLAAGRDAKGTGHATDCRGRLEKLVQNDPLTAARFEQAEEKKTRYLAQEVERNADMMVRREVNNPATPAPKRTMEPSEAELPVPEATPAAMVGDPSPGQGGRCHRNRRRSVLV